jgi:hypothetical protein
MPSALARDCTRRGFLGFPLPPDVTHNLQRRPYFARTEADLRPRSARPELLLLAGSS